MALSPITSLQIDEGKVETVTDFIFLGSQSTVDVDCSQGTELAPWKESYEIPRLYTKKQRHYFADKHQHIVKAVVFPLLMYGCESWTIKKTEDQRIDAFELQC